MSTGVIFILGKGVSPILASGVKSTWPQGSSEPGFSSYGSALIEFAKQEGATKVDVNDQNLSALNFYKAKGFRIISRDETDDVGRPYPILHLSL